MNEIGGRRVPSSGGPRNKTFSNVLKVAKDPPGISDEERAKRKKALAGAIAHSLRQFGEVKVRALGMNVLPRERSA